MVDRDTREIACPHCGGIVKVGAHRHHHKDTCPHCKQEFQPIGEDTAVVAVEFLKGLASTDKAKSKG